MAGATATALLRISTRASSTIYANGLHTSHTCYLDQGWRKQKGLAENPNAYGPLTNDPDYTFKDGRPTPYGVRQRIRIDKQREYTTRIIQLVKQIDFAVERHAKLEEEKKAEAKQLLDRKLKPKGKFYKPLSEETQ